MIRLAPPFLLLLICSLFFACATDRASYERPLQELEVLPEEQEESKEEQPLAEISKEALANIQPNQRPDLNTDEAGLWMIMDKAEESLKTSGYLIRDRKLNGYLKEITCRLVPEYCEDIRIYLVQVPYFNATMAPNGAMQIWTGLLLRVQNEAQLAAILGHEIGHYLRRHSLQRMKDIIDTSSVLVFVQLATALAGVPLAGDVMQLIAIGSIQAFSREQEREADGYGLALMSRAGYDPREAAKVWAQIMEEVKADKEKEIVPIYLSTHPATEERHAALVDLAQRVVARGGTYELGEAPFLEHVLPHRAEYFKDELHLRHFDRTEKLIEILSQKGFNPGEIHFFKGELFRLRADEGDIQEAIKEYEKALQSGYKNPETYRAMGLLCLKAGKRKEAMDAFNHYLESCPDCTDRKMIQHMMKECKP